MLPEATSRILSDGRRCLVRIADRSDAAGLLELERLLTKARLGVVKRTEEVPRDVEAFVVHAGASLSRPSPMSFRMIAEMEGLGIVADLMFVRFGLRALRHGGTLGLGVHPSAQGAGLGRLLLGRLVAWARAHRDPDGGRILRIELYVRGDNERAVALYRACGFEVEGVRREFVRRDDGSFVDDFVMALRLGAGADEGATPA